MSSENDRISQQRVARRDLLLPSQPMLTRLNALFMRLLTFHICFCGAVLILGTALPVGARLLANVVSPISSIVFWLYPAYLLPFEGPLGADFYRSVIGETFFMSFITLCVYQAIYVARYWRCPWRFNEFYMEQLGIQPGILSAMVTTAITAPIAVLFGAVLVNWFGFTVSEPEVKLVKAYQLALWCFMTPAAALAFVLALSLAVSSMLAALRGLFR